MPRLTVINLVLAVLLVTLGAIAWLRPGIEPEASSFSVFSVDRSQLELVHAEKHGETIYRLEKIDGEWQLTAPLTGPANPDAVDNLLDKTRLRSRDRYPAESVDPDDAGLAEPFMRLQLDEEEILVGDSEAISQRRYVRAGNWIYLVDGLEIFSLDRDASNLLLEPVNGEQSADEN